MAAPRFLGHDFASGGASASSSRRPRQCALRHLGPIRQFRPLEPVGMTAPAHGAHRALASLRRLRGRRARIQRLQAFATGFLGTRRSVAHRRGALAAAFRALERPKRPPGQSGSRPATQSTKRARGLRPRARNQVFQSVAMRFPGARRAARRARANPAASRGGPNRRLVRAARPRLLPPTGQEIPAPGENSIFSEPCGAKNSAPPNVREVCAGASRGPGTADPSGPRRNRDSGRVRVRF